MKVTLPTYGFPTYQHSFLERYVEEIVGMGTDVCVVATDASDHDPVLGPDARGSLEIIDARWSAPRARKAVTLAEVLVGAARANPEALRRLARSLERHHGRGRKLASELSALAPVLARPADVVHFAWLGVAVRSVELLTALDRPVVVSCHGSDLLIDPLLGDRYLRPLAEVFARADVVHCVSHDLGNRAVELGLDPAKLVVCPWGVDTARFHPAGPGDREDRPDARPLRVVTVSRVHWVKGYEYALDALARLVASGVEVEYTVIGHADDKARLMLLATARDLGLSPCVTVLGVRSPEEIADMLRAADVFLLASLSEGISTATLEAMASGLPVVVTDVGGTREAVRDGVDGFVVAPRDPDALACALQAVAADPQLRARMGRAGRDRVVERFDAVARARELSTTYGRLAPAGAA